MQDFVSNTAEVIFGVFAVSAVLLTAVCSFVCVRCIKSKQNNQTYSKASNQPECCFINDIDGYQVECIDKPSPSAIGNRFKTTNGAFFKIFSKRHYRNRSLQRALPDLPRSPAPAIHAPNITRESSSSDLYATVDKKSSSYSGAGLAANARDMNKNGPLRELIEDRPEDGKHPKSRITRRHSSSSLSSLNTISVDQNHLYSRIKGNEYDLYSGILPKIKNDAVDTYNETLYNVESISDADPFYAKLTDVNPISHFSAHCSKDALYGRTKHFDLIENGRNPEHFDANHMVNKINTEDPYSSIRSDDNYSPLDIADRQNLEFRDNTVPSTSDSNGFSSRFRYPFLHTLCKFSPKPAMRLGFNRPRIERTLSDSGTDYGFCRRKFTAESLYSRPLPRHFRPTKMLKKRDSTIAEQEDNDDESPTLYHSRSNKDEGPEPNYRYLTVRESLDVLMARLALQRAPEVTNSDPNSLHYYSTISEHNYETVPYAIACNLRSKTRATQEYANRRLDADPTYIDDNVTYDYDLNNEQNLPSCSNMNRRKSPTENSSNNVTRINIDDCGVINDDRNYYSSTHYSRPEHVFPLDQTTLPRVSGGIQNSKFPRALNKHCCTSCDCEKFARKNDPCFCACHSSNV